MPYQPYPTGGGQLRSVFQYLLDFGFQDFLLPVLLIFTLIFAILQMTKLFKEPKRDAQGNVVQDQFVGDRKVNAIIAIVIALMTVLPHTVGWYPPDRDPIALMSSFLPSTVVVLIAVFMVILLLGLAGATIPSGMQLFIGAIGVGFLVYIFLLNTFPTYFPAFDFLRDPSVQALLIVLLVMGLIGYWVIRPGPGEEMPKKLKRWMVERQPPAGGG